MDVAMGNANVEAYLRAAHRRLALGAGASALATGALAGTAAGTLLWLEGASIALALAAAGALSTMAFCAGYSLAARALDTRAARLILLKRLDRAAHLSGALLTLDDAEAGPFHPLLKTRVENGVDRMAIGRALPHWRLAPWVAALCLWAMLGSSAIWLAPRIRSGAEPADTHIAAVQGSDSDRDMADDSAQSEKNKPDNTASAPGRQRDAGAGQGDGAGEQPKPEPGSAGAASSDGDTPAQAGNPGEGDIPKAQPSATRPSSTAAHEESGGERDPRPWEMPPETSQPDETPPQPAPGQPSPADPFKTLPGMPSPPTPLAEIKDYVEREVRISPKAGAGEHKEVLAHRDVYDPKGRESGDPRPVVGAPPVAPAPQRSWLGSGGLSAADRAWAQEWLKKFRARD